MVYYGVVVVAFVAPVILYNTRDQIPMNWKRVVYVMDLCAIGGIVIGALIWYSLTAPQLRRRERETRE
jgi:NADH:ubiquinone oxidoreductase subunit 6 (subunit J)